MNNIERNLTPREAWTQARRERVVGASSELISPLLSDIRT